MFSNIEKRYDPEFDTPNGGPPVTWAEKDLYDEVIDLQKVIANLAARVDHLEEMRSNITETLATHDSENDLGLAIWSAIIA